MLLSLSSLIQLLVLTINEHGRACQRLSVCCAIGPLLIMSNVVQQCCC
jgi:hypothetical protein